VQGKIVNIVSKGAIIFGQRN